MGWRPERRWIRGRWIPVTIGEKCRTPEEGEGNCYAWGLKHQCEHAAEEPTELCPHHARMRPSLVRSSSTRSA